MVLTAQTFMIVCPFVFLAGLIDAIGGGGGLISLPIYLVAGLPVHQAVATNKLSSCCGTTLTTGRFIKNGLINFKLGIPSVIAAVIGSGIGANLSMKADTKVMEYLLYIILPVTAVVVLNKNLLKDNGSEELVLNMRTYSVTVLSALIIGLYDGFYGPGTGTFLIICFCVFAKMSVKNANGQAKLINMTTNITSLTIYLLNGQVLLPLGIAAALCNMAGGYIGAGLVMTKGTKIVKPVIIFVLLLLFLKVTGVLG